jgi:Lon protease-like protein
MTEGRHISPLQDPEDLMGDCNTDARTGPSSIKPDGLDAHRDARAIVRLVQCTQCSYPLQQPMTLPCGNSLCRKCLPQPHVREHVSYPNDPTRQEGITCPFEDCGMEHSWADFSLDVTLTKVMNVIGTEIATYRPITFDTPLLLEQQMVESLKCVSPTSSLKDEKTLEYSQPRSRVLHGGRLVATYTLAEMGELAYSSSVSYHSLATSNETFQHLDVARLEHLKEATRQELDCQVCYNLMLDPLTTTCGHTFCRKCLHRVFDHSTICPVCRRNLSMRPSLNVEPSNARLTSLLSGLCPDLLASRASLLDAEAAGLSPELTTPLFVCTLSYPTMPTFLHIFEPRYRLMIRRAIESGDRKFGMMMYNREGTSQGDLGATQFMEYGTLLHIISVQMMPDGRSLIETVGVSRFRVKSWALLDGYTVGSIERVDDISIADEERAEVLETTNVSTPESPASPAALSQLDSLSTTALYAICATFIQKMQSISAPWLHERVLRAYGNPPDDPAQFPYWFASILPISDEEKYRLIPTTSVRERLKICARWVGGIERSRW